MSAPPDGFAAEALDFLAAHGAPRPPDTLAWGEGPENLTIFHETIGEAERAELEAAKSWQATKWEHGFGWLRGPVEYGGRGLDAAHERLFRSLEATYDVPDWQPIRIGLSTVSPSLVLNGAPEQITAYAGGIQKGRVVACQLFSEPEAGSDLAAVRTRAVQDGDVWRLSGQKVWTSNAQFADIGLALARTDLEAPKHANLTAFLVPMDAAGVEVRPLRQLTGGASFCEVFLDDTAVSDDLRVGPVGGGWRVAVSTLAAERQSTGDRSHGLTARALAMLIALARKQGLATDPLCRQRVADVAARLRVASFHQQRMEATATKGPERALDKLFLADNLRRIGAAAALMLGPRLTADVGDWGTYAWGSWILGATGYRLGGGTDEILRTVIGERLLDLPREPQ